MLSAECKQKKIKPTFEPTTWDKLKSFGHPFIFEMILLFSSSNLISQVILLDSTEVVAA